MRYIWNNYEFVSYSDNGHDASYYDPARLSRGGHSSSSYLPKQLLHADVQTYRRIDQTVRSVITTVALRAWLAMCRRALERHCLATCTREISQARARVDWGHASANLHLCSRYQAGDGRQCAFLCPLINVTIPAHARHAV